MELKSLRLFLEAAESGSFVAAAERANTVQSNVTAHIKKLESELNTQLFERKGGIRLTGAGTTLLDHARKILSSHDDVLGLFQQQHSANSRLRIASMETTTAIRLPAILAAFYQRYPQVDLTVETSPSAQLVERLIKGEADGIFVAGETRHSQFYHQKVFSEQLVLVGPGEFTHIPAAEELLESAFLSFRQGCSYRQRIELFLASQGIHSTRIFEFGSIDGMLGCVAGGMGYALMPLSVVLSHQGRFNIGYQEIADDIALVDTYFSTGNPQSWSPALKQFVELLPRLK
jgi:DNA-binding transcriptional LysR family regulator